MSTISSARRFWQRWLGSSLTPATTGAPRRLRPAVEVLETRDLLAAAVVNLVTPTLQLAPGLAEVGAGNATSFAAVHLIGHTSAGATVTLATKTVTANLAGDFSFFDVPLAAGANTFTANASLKGKKASVTTIISRTAVPDGVTVLKEEGRFLTETSVPVDLGVTTGTRILQFDVQAVFNRTAKMASGDALVVSLVDPAQPTQTLLSSHGPGSPLFSLTETGNDYKPGLVQFDGRTVQIDVSQVTGHATGTLLFQLLSADTDTGSEVHLGAVSNTVDPDAAPRPQTPALGDGAAAGPALATTLLAGYKTVAASLVVSNVRFDEGTNRYSADLQVVNTAKTMISRNVAALFSGLPAGVSIVGASGLNSKGLPYLNFGNAIPSGGLAPGKSSAPVRIVVNNPGRVPFALSSNVVGKANQAPTFTAPSKTVLVGAYVEVPLKGKDPNGDAISYRIVSGKLPTGQLRPDGTLVLAPAPGDVGVYNVKIVASDGTLETSRTAKITVNKDKVTTTRVSGIVADVGGKPIAGMKVEVGAVQGLTDKKGAFLLNLGTGLPATLTIKIRGETDPSGKYPFIAEKMKLLMGHDLYVGANNMIGRPIYLPTLEAGTTINPAQDQTVTSTDPDLAGVSVMIQAGTLQNSSGQAFTGKLSITEVPASQTPAVLPKNLLPDMLVTIQPGEMSFSVPAPLTFPNRAGYAPGTIMDLWSINPSTGEFEKVGTCQVNAAGTLIETITGGVRNSSWHFPAPRPVTPSDPKTNKSNLVRTGGDQCCNAPATSGVELHTGALSETHDLVGYQSLGQTRQFTLSYYSLSADPRPVLHFGYSNIVPDANQRLVATLVERRGDFSFTLPGFTGGSMGLTGGEHFWKVDVAGNVNVALQTDFRSLPSGVYDYDLTTGLLQLANGRFSGATSTQTGQISIVNGRGSVFGNGWGIAGLTQLVANPDGSLLFIDGDGSYLNFGAPAAAGQPYQAPPGDFTTLVKLGDGTYTRTHPDRTIERFDTLGRIVSATDRDGNATQYQYNTSGIAKIIDPVGLATTFSYTSGRVTKIVDPANRTTILTYDANGNLTSIKDPDGATRTWEYDTDFHMTGETDARGNRESEGYNFAGQVVRATTKDGRVLTYNPVQAQDLYPAELTSNPATAPSLFPLSTPRATYTDAKGNLIEVLLDQAGQLVSSRDAAGQLASMQRNAANLVSQAKDGRGNTTDYLYDAKGNVTRSTEQLASLPTNAGGLDERRNDPAARSQAGFNASALAATDDGSSGQVDIGFDINFFGTTYNKLFVNNNGNVTFDSALSTFTPFNLLSTNRVIIAPFFADADTRGRGTVTYGQDLIDGHKVFGINWTGIGYYNSGTDKGNTFQLVLIDRSDVAPGDFDFEINYTQIQWETGNASGGSGGLGGNSARAGFSNGQNQSFEIGGSAVNGGLLDSNAATGLIHTKRASVVNGRYRFEVHNGAVLSARRDYTYDANFNQVASMTDELGRQTLNDIDPANGNITKTTRVVGLLDSAQNGETNDVLESYTYNPRGQVLTITDPLLHVTTFEYDTHGQLIKLTRATGTLDQTVRRFEYDLAGNITALIDENNHRTVSSYDSMNRVTKIVEADPDDAGPLTSPTTQFVYDANGNLTTVTDPRGFVTQNNYDPLDRLIAAALDPDGAGPRPTSVVRYTYDSAGNVLSKTDPLGHTTRYEYDTRNRRVTVIAPDGGVSRVVYDEDNNVIQMTDPLGHVTDYAYDSRDRLLRVTDALDHATLYGYDADNNLRSIIDRNGYKTLYDYDELNRLVKITDAKNGTTTFEYDKAGNRITAMDPLLRRTQYGFDGLDRQTSITTPLGNVLGFAYDAAGNLISSSDGLHQTTTFTYDALDRLVQQTDARNGTMKFAHDPSGNLTGMTDQLNRTWVFAYDGFNQQTKMTDPLGHSQEMTYDAAENLVQFKDGMGQTTVSAYDPLHRLTSTTDSRGGVTSYTYDLTGNLRTLIDPDTNQTTFNYDALNRLTSATNGLNAALVYAYDFEGNMASITDRDGRVRQFTYDELNRKTAEQWLDSGNNVIRTLTFTYDAASQLKTASDIDSASAYDYDLDGRLTTLTNAGTPGAPTVAFGYGYDAADNKSNRTDTIAGQAAATIDYKYDELNRLTRLSESGAAIGAKRVDIGYNAASEMTGVTRFSDLAGTQEVATSSYGYDLAGRLTGLTHKHAGVNVAAYNWAYDAADRITQATTPDGTSVYSYDLTDQLTGVDHSFQTDESYSYDLNGNRTGNGYQTDPNNRMKSDGEFNYTYDAEGNRISQTNIVSGDVTTYAWDHRNRLTQVTMRASGGAILMQASYTYDVFDRRIAKVVDADGDAPGAATTERFVYDGNQIALSFSGAGVQTHRYLYGPAVDQVLADETAVGQVLWPLGDNLGTIRDIVDAAGVVQNHIKYDSFGQVTSESNAALDVMFGYTGRELDQETGLMYYRARYYDVENGRFISEDPIGFDGQDANLNRYVGNRPSSLTDPSGLQSPSPSPNPSAGKVAECFSGGPLEYSILTGAKPKSGVIPTPRDRADAAKAYQNEFGLQPMEGTITENGFVPDGSKTPITLNSTTPILTPGHCAVQKPDDNTTREMYQSFGHNNQGDKGAIPLSTAEQRIRCPKDYSVIEQVRDAKKNGTDYKTEESTPDAYKVQQDRWNKIHKGEKATIFVKPGTKP